MQCYEFLAIRQYARQFLGNARDCYDDLELADRLDELEVDSILDLDRVNSARTDGASTRL